jgi:hypothetical protein
MTNKKSRPVSVTFVMFLLVFLGLLGYFCYQIVSQTGMIPSKSSPAPDSIQVDTNRLKLDQRDSIIATKDSEIAILKLKLEEKPDTIFVPKYTRKPDSISIRPIKPSISKPDSI